MMVKLKQIANIRLGMAFKSAPKNNGEQSFITLIQSKDISADGLPSVEFLPKVEPEYDPSHHIIKRNEILIRLRGPVFSTAVFTEDYLAVTTNQIGVISCNDEVINPLFLNWYLNAEQGKRFFASYNEGTSIAKVSTKALGEMNIELPSLEKQQQIANIYHNWLQQKAIHQQLIANGDLMTTGICNDIYKNRQD